MKKMSDLMREVTAREEGSVLKQMAKLSAELDRHPPYLTAVERPRIEITLPTPEERAEFESAAKIVEAVKMGIEAWHRQTKPDEQVVVLATLADGTTMRVHNLRALTHHTILLEGWLNVSPCFVTLHQSSLQILCYAEQIKAGSKQNPIGFVPSGKSPEPDSQEPENQP